jgi:signal transduction histidine kinase
MAIPPILAPFGAAPEPTAIDSPFCRLAGEAIQARQRELSLTWLERLVALLPVEVNSVFTSNELLDHIPTLIAEIGKYVAAPESGDIAANTVVTEHARALGQLRHRQQASVHQVLREYDLLAELLAEHLDERAASMPSPPESRDCLEATRRVGRAVRVLMQVTVATFIAEYSDTITGQAARITRFNQALSHELRNVLGTIHYAAGVLASSSPAAAAARERVTATLTRNTDRALQIVRSLERLPSSGVLATGSPSEQLIDLGELVDEVFRQLREMAEARSVALRSIGPFPRIYVDTGRLELVLVNLVANAVKYSDPRKTARYVEVTADTRAESYEIRVADNGVGIPAVAIGKIFERFQRAHEHLDATLGIEGSGLGLAIVEECIGSLAGEIVVESDEGVGATFTIKLPKRLPASSLASIS